MKKRFDDICRAAMADPGGRGLSGHTTHLPRLEQIAQSLAGAKGVMLISGFPVRTEWGVVCETDGPSGIVWLAQAFCKLGISVRVYTDEICEKQVRAALAAAAPEAVFCRLPFRPDADWTNRQFDEFCPSHLLTLERPGKAADGHCYNIRGLVIDDVCANAEPLFKEAKKRGVVTVAVGDGGNEMGTGGCRDLVERHVSKGDLICARQIADHTLVAGVSNWWGWGLCGAMQLVTGTSLLPSASQETAVLEAVLASGGADGTTARSAMTVDNLPLSAHLAVLEQIRQAVTDRDE